eukprot:scaffold181098_cov18-Tisochrysis_lutea.AAC.2
MLQAIAKPICGCAGVDPPYDRRLMLDAFWLLCTSKCGCARAPPRKQAKAGQAPFLCLLACVITGSWDETMRLWDVETGNTLCIFSANAKVCGCGYVPSRLNIYVLLASHIRTVAVFPVTINKVQSNGTHHGRGGQLDEIRRRWQWEKAFEAVVNPACYGPVCAGVSKQCKTNVSHGTSSQPSQLTSRAQNKATKQKQWQWQALDATPGSSPGRSAGPLKPTALVKEAQFFSRTHGVADH